MTLPTDRDPATTDGGTSSGGFGQETSIASACEPRGRRQDIELLRIASAFGIVLFHSGSDATGIGYSGLVVFLVLSTCFSAAGPARDPSFGRILSRRSLRLLVPWAFWMVAYGVRNHFVGRNILETDRGWPNGILAGTQIHLWFLPYLFLASVALDLVRTRAKRAHLGWIAGIAAIGLLATAAIWRPWAERFGYPTVQYCHGLAGLFAGVFLANFRQIGPASRKLLLAGLLGSAALALWRRIDGVGIPYSVGLALCSWFLLRPWKFADRWNVRPVSDCMFGVYLVHIFFDRMYNVVPGLPDPAEPILTFATSLALVWLLRRFAWRIARRIT